MTHVSNTAPKKKNSSILGRTLSTGAKKMHSDRSPEYEYLENLADIDDLVNKNNDDRDAALDYAHKRINRYVDDINSRIRTVKGVEDYLRLAENQRRTFQPPKGTNAPKPRNPLAETRVGMPSAKKAKDAAALRMTTQGTVQETFVPNDRAGDLKKSGFMRSYMISGCPFS
jgi:hypothetical protein